jgi:CcdB protein
VVIEQYDIVQIEGGRKGQLCIVLQSDITDITPTVIVAPLALLSELKPIPKLAIQVEHEGRQYTILVYRMAAITRAQIRKKHGNCAQLHNSFMGAVDLLFAGI